ncbi:MAG: S8 family serine peptidase [Candidatus Sericytochromatia bacterium]|nr:S8 family serine peptidase [Candidatus Tanganyikabacteria bacterium]
MATRYGSLGWALALVASGCGLLAPVGAGPTRAEITNRQLIVLYEPGVEPRPLEFREQRLNVVDEFDLIGKVQVLDVPAPLSVPEAARQIQGLPGVRGATPNRAKTWSLSPNDPLVYRQWWVNGARSGLRAQQLWDRQDDASAVVVAVLDSGIDYVHPELAGRVLLGINTLERPASRDVLDRDGHGTHVAGIIGAAGNNALGVAGVTWNVKMMALKVLDRDGGNDAAALAAISYAARNGAKVINMSFNSEDRTISQGYTDAVAFARQQGAVVVGASGNDGGPVTQPANTPGVLAVAALAGNGTSVAGYSNLGATVRLAAPGDDILSTVPGGRYANDSGTSMAAPFVSAAAAIVWARHPDWTVEQVEKAVQGAAVPLAGHGDRLGRLDYTLLP